MNERIGFLLVMGRPEFFNEYLLVGEQINRRGYRSMVCTFKINTFLTPICNERIRIVEHKGS